MYTDSKHVNFFLLQAVIFQSGYDNNTTTILQSSIIYTRTKKNNVEHNYNFLNTTFWFVWCKNNIIVQILLFACSEFLRIAFNIFSLKKNAVISF